MRDLSREAGQCCCERAGDGKGVDVGAQVQMRDGYVRGGELGFGKMGRFGKGGGDDRCVGMEEISRGSKVRG